MSLGGCVRAWFALLTLEVLLTLAFASTGHLQDVAEAEFARSRGILGNALAERVATAAVAATSLFDVPAGNSGVEAWQPSRRGLDVVRERGRALLLLVIIRAALWREGATAAISCVFAAAVDGLMMRRRRAFEFETVNTALYNAAAYLLICATMASLACLVAPVPMPATTFVVLGLVLMIGIWTVCVHLPGPATLVAGYPRV